MKKKIYLCGAIAGLTFDAANEWRQKVSAELSTGYVECVSPMRGKEHLFGTREITKEQYRHTLASDQAIIRRDHWDCFRCDLLFCNLFGAMQVSIGSVFELAWCYHRQIPVVIVMETDSMHDHPFVRQAGTYITDSLESGIELARVALS